MQVLAWKSPQVRVCTRFHCQKPAASLSYLLFWVSMCHKLGFTQWFPDKSQDIRDCKPRLNKTRGNSLVVWWLGLHTLIAEALGKRWLYFLEMLYDFYTLLVIRNALWIWKDTKFYFKISLVLLPRENIKQKSWIESCWNLTMNLLSFQCSLVVYTRLIRATRFEEIMKEKFHLPSAFSSKD